MRIASVMIPYIDRDPLPEIGFKTVYAAIQQSFQLSGVPFYSCRIGEVNMLTETTNVE